MYESKSAEHCQSPRPLSTNDVFLRIKPSSSKSNGSAYTLLNATTLLIRKNENIDKKYTFTKIFNSDSSQTDVFDSGIRQRLVDFLFGESLTILTYGISNSGKTYTLYGTPYEPGVIPRAIEFIFSAVNCTLEPWYKVTDDNRVIALNEYERAQERQSKCSMFNLKGIGKAETLEARLSLSNSSSKLSDSKEQGAYTDEIMSSVWISAAEIYNDNVYDLLAVNYPALKLSSRKDGSTCVNGLKFVYVTTALEACQLLIFAQSRMTVASTVINSESSRSHTFFTIKLLRYQKENAPDTVQLSTLTFCDLAGSRRFKSNEEVVRLIESRSINNSLLVLGRCMNAICDGHSYGDQVAGPFRESKLTRILQKALLGRETMNFFFTVDISHLYFAETLCVLNISSIAKRLTIDSRDLKRSSALKSLRRNIASREDTFQRQKDDLASKENECNKNVLTDVSNRSQSEDALIDYKELQEANTKLKECIENLKCDHLNRELEIRQELANQFTTAMQELDNCWRKRTQDIENKSEDLLRSSVNQVEMFYKERIDNIRSKKRKRNKDEDDEQSLFEEFETENALLTSKVVVLRDMLRNLKHENELLVTERNKYSFELSLLKDEFDNFNDLIRAHFPDLFSNSKDDNRVVWVFQKLKSMFDEKDRNIETLEKDLNGVKNDYSKMASKSAETEKRLNETKELLRETTNDVNNFEDKANKYAEMIHKLEAQLKREITDDYGCFSDEFFCDEPIETTDFVTQIHVDTKRCELKKNSKRLGTRSYFETDRSTFEYSDGDAKEDSGIDSSYRSRISTSATDNSVIHEAKDMSTQISDELSAICYSDLATKEGIEQVLSQQVDDVEGIINILQKVTDLKELELEECKKKLSTCECELEDLTKHADTRRIDELTRQLSIKEENENRIKSQLTESLNKCAQMEKELGILQAAHKSLKKELQAKCFETNEINDKLAKAEDGLFRVQKKVDELETILEKWQKDQNRRLQEYMNAQSMFEDKLDCLKMKTSDNNNQLISLKTNVANVMQLSCTNKEKASNLGKQISQSYGTLSDLKEELSRFDDVQRVLKKISEEIFNRREQSFTDREEFNQLKLQLVAKESEMDFFKKRRNTMITKYECMVERLRIEVEKKKERLEKLERLVLPNFVRRNRKSHKQRYRNYVHCLKSGSVKSNDEVDKTIDKESDSLASGDVCSLVSYLSGKGIADSVCKSERSCPTESSSGLNVDAQCQTQSTVSNCSEVQCDCGVGFRDAVKHGTMSGWMKLWEIEPEENISLDIKRQLV